MKRGAAALLTAAMLLLSGCGGEGSEEAGGSAFLPEEEKEETVQFPATVAGGLEVISLFPYSGINPDCGCEMGENIGSLEVANRSGRYLEEAAFTVRLTDGGTMEFLVRDLPAEGKTVAFSVDNAAYDGGECAAVEAEAAFSDGDMLMEGKVSFAVEGATVALTNLTEAEIGPLTVTCHDTLDEAEFFGGASYAYGTESIPAGGSVSVEAFDCLIGEAAVVQISQND